MQKLSPRAKTLQMQASIAYRERLRQHIIATMEPGATEIDVEIELAMRIQEGLCGKDID